MKKIILLYRENIRCCDGDLRHLTGIFTDSCLSSWSQAVKFNKNWVYCFTILLLMFGQASFYGQSNTNNSQWGKNGPASSPASPVNWANGNAQGTNSHFKEGQSIPTRIELDGLTAGQPASVTFNINIVQGSDGQHAFDFFTGANRIDEAVQPLDGLSGYGARSLFTFPIPNAGNTGGVPAGYYDQTALKMGCQQTADAAFPEKNSIWIYNGTVTGITYVWGNEDGASTQQTYCTVTFTPTSTKTLLVLGCHIAAELTVSCAGWGVGNGASAISGSPYHFHIQSICSPLSNCVVLGSQDQQMASDAVIIPPLCSITPSSAEVCAGATATFTASGSNGSGGPPYTFAWTGPGGFTATTPSITVGVAGTYFVTVRDKNGVPTENPCSASLAVNPLPNLSATPTHVACNGQATGSIALTVTLGTPSYSYVWTGSNGGVVPAGQANLEDPSGLVAGTYSVVVTDSKGCTANTQVTITEPPLVLPDITKDPGFASSPCGVSPTQAQSQVNTAFNAWIAAGVTVVNGGTLPNSITMSPPNPTAPLYTGGSTQVTWTITDACNKTDVVVVSFDVSNNCAITCLATPSPLACNGVSTGSILAKGSGGFPPYNFYLYLSSDLNTQLASVLGVNTEPGEATFPNLAAGNYTVLITDSVQTLADATACDATVTQPSALQASDSHTDALCNGDSTGSVTLTFSGGTGPYMVNFNGGGFASQVSGVVYNNLAAGTYNWIVQDANNCTTNGSEEVGQASSLQASDSHADALCNGGSSGSVTLTFSGGTGPYMVNFNGGGFASQVSGVVYSNLAAGTYNWIVQDANNCTTNGSEEVGQPSALQASDSHADVLCNGGSTGSVTLTFSGGTGPYMVNFNGGGFASQVSGVVYSNLTAGTYNWIVQDANNCTANGSEEVGQPSALQASDSHADVLCNGGSSGSVTLTFSGGTGPYMVNFNGGGFASQVSGVVYNNLATGTYNWIVQDANNCTANGSEEVGQPSAIQLSLTSLPENCANTATGSITATFSGGVGSYMLSIDGGPFALATSPHTFDNLGGGSHTIAIKDGNNCTDDDSITVGTTPCGGHIFPTQTTCCNFVTGTASTLLNVCTTVRGNYVNNAVPGVFFYYSNVVAPAASFTIEVKQFNDGDLDKLFKVQGYAKNNLQQIRLFTSNCGNVTFVASFIDKGTGARMVVTGATPGATYIISIKYDVKAIIGGVYSGADLSSTYTFSSFTTVGADPSVPVPGSTGTLDAVAGCTDNTPLPGDCQIGGAIQEPTASNLIDTNEPTFTAYPVPFKDVITIRYQFKYTSKATIQIFDTKGSLLMSQQDNDAYFNKEMTIKPSFHRSEGQLFYVKIITDKGVSIKKVMSDN